MFEHSALWPHVQKASSEPVNFNFWKNVWSLYSHLLYLLYVQKGYSWALPGTGLLSFCPSFPAVLGMTPHDSDYKPGYNIVQCLTAGFLSFSSLMCVQTLWKAKTGCNRDIVITRPPDTSAYLKIIFLISESKHMLWVLKRTVLLRRFFWAPKTHVKTDE